MTVVLSGCSRNLSSYNQVPAALSTSPAPENTEPYNPQEMTKQDLEKEIYELEEIIIRLNTDIADSRFGSIEMYIGRLFMPVTYLDYYEKKVTYIDKYGTEEQKEKLREIQAKMEKEVDEGKNAIFDFKYHMSLIEL